MKQTNNTQNQKEYIPQNLEARENPVGSLGYDGIPKDNIDDADDADDADGADDADYTDDANGAKDLDDMNNQDEQNNKIGLYCTFTDMRSYKKVVKDIFDTYDIRGNKIFALIPRRFTKKREVYLTYHVVINNSDKSKIPNTILTHRKKFTNTLFTINAMNKIIKEKTGFLDKNYTLEWNSYRDTLIISNEKGVRIIPIKVMRVFKKYNR